MRAIDITGQTFGRLVAIERVENSKKGEARFRFKCQCGGNTISLGKDVRNGHTKSCGCLDRESTSGRATERNRIHGMTNTPEFRSWHSMIKRCTHPSHTFWKRYGGRGITVCDRWRNGEGGRSGFECFYDDMGIRRRGLTIDRINNDGNYEPSNCRWATHSEQQKNKGQNGIYRVQS